MDVPFTPKSTIGLRYGDYWAVHREDGFFGFLVYLKSAHGRSTFVAAVLNHVQPNRALEPQGPLFEIHRWGVIDRIGNLHVKTFRETDCQILGNIAARLPADKINAAYQVRETNINVWGYRLPIKLVNDIRSGETSGA